ncbi:MAG TPA: aldehyde dehydrogenase (NADP(+)), partial [Ferruginibacter sp.]|nr:aldehyde dehydrogenase (NADP(+)) [Ferruginibacter sp.]
WNIRKKKFLCRFILQEKLITEAEEYAKLLAASINSSTGQFCTCPGIIVGINNDSFNNFIVALSTNFSSYAAAQMLNQGIFENYQSTMQSILQQHAVQKIEIPKAKALPNEALPALAMVNAQDFILNPSLMQEVFGPFCLMVKCTDYAEMLLVAQHMQGQLTATIIASENEMNVHKDLIDSMKTLCGRIIFNAVPTGVQVSLAMQHGGPYPATTDSRFTAVGADGIKRFCRPIAYQNWPNNHLPEELKNENPLQLWRTVNNIPGRH